MHYGYRKDQLPEVGSIRQQASASTMAASQEPGGGGGGEVWGPGRGGAGGVWGSVGGVCVHVCGHRNIPLLFV